MMKIHKYKIDQVLTKLGLHVIILVQFKFSSNCLLKKFKKLDIDKNENL